MNKPMYQRVLLKLSGEGLSGDDSAIDGSILQRLALDIKKAVCKGVSFGLVVGGGNFWRGAKGTSHIERVTGDYIGMIATTMNALALRDALNAVGVKAVVQSALPIKGVVGAFCRIKARFLMRRGVVVIFAGGTGKPYFTTDTCAVLRAVQTKCDACLKSTQVDGIYDSDPRKNKKAKKYDVVSYRQALDEKLGVMDLSAIEMAQKNKMPVVVFNQSKEGSLLDVLCGKGVCSTMKDI